MEIEVTLRVVGVNRYDFKPADSDKNIKGLSVNYLSPIPSDREGAAGSEVLKAKASYELYGVFLKLKESYPVDFRCKCTMTKAGLHIESAVLAPVAKEVKAA